MNIVIYNFDDASAEELNDFSSQVNSSIFFALSFSEVKKLLSSHQMDVAVLKILESSEKESLKTIIKKNPKTEFYLSMKKRLEKCDEHKIHIEALNTSLTTIAKQIILN